MYEYFRFNLEPFFDSFKRCFQAAQQWAFEASVKTVSIAIGIDCSTAKSGARLIFIC